jgi:Domain of unknown function (DUF1929)
MRRAPSLVAAVFALVALLGSLVTSPAAGDMSAAPSSATPPMAIARKGTTCNTVARVDIGRCVSRMLSDPDGAYSAKHVFTAAEKQPVTAPRRLAATAARGSWSVAANCSVDGYKVNPIHASVTRTGKVLMTAGSGYSKRYFDSKVFKTWLWDPTTPGVCPKEIPMPPGKDLFCSGHSHLADGSVLFFGGTSRYGVTHGVYYGGIRESYVFDDVTETFIAKGLMNVARWYPNGPINAAGNPIVVAGLDLKSKLTSVNELYSPATGRFTKLTGPRAFPMYASMVLRKNGTLCYTGGYFGGRVGVSPQCWNWSDNTSTVIPGLQHPDCRDQANNLLLYPAQAQKSMLISGGCSTGVTGTTAVVDLKAASPRFVPGPYLGFGAMHACATVLPDGSAFVAGGADHNKNPRLLASRLPVGATAWQPVAPPKVPRMYHSSCVLLPDGSVLTMGTNAGADPAGRILVESRFEVYRPWYLASTIVRPTITTPVATLETLQFGKTYAVTYSGPAVVTDATLTSLPSVTHSTDPNQRVVRATVTQRGARRVNLKVEPNRGVLPPGVYMLSLKDSRGVPSLSRMVRIVKGTAVAGSDSTPGPALTCCCSCAAGCCQNSHR